MVKLSYITEDKPYNQIKLGIYGNLGKGENADILFLQTVITAAELDGIHLISNIPGSEKWNVKDLFQRDVDDERVTNDIIPYFKDQHKIKYFSPITLILLPTENGKRDIIKEIEFIEPQIIDNAVEGNINTIYEKKSFYKLNLYKTNDQIASLEWSDKNCYLVAIDGQHRLSGLMRWKKAPDSNFEDWKIPVVILTILKVDRDKSVANLLEIVRKTFVYINQKSEKINMARAILLNDESVNAICTQELIEFSHRNDVKAIGNRDNSIMPLIFYDWQGKVINKKQVEGPASLKSVEEIHLWFSEYLLGTDGSPSQASELCLTDLLPPLEGFGPKLSLSNKDAKRIRKQANDIILPGLLYFLQNFYPYKIYIEKCREIENKALEKSDIVAHAFVKLRFGTHNAPPDQSKAVEEEFKNLIQIFESQKKSKIDEIIRLDIGMRGVIFAFQEVKEALIDFLGTNINWIDFSKEFTPIMNDIYNQKWFKGYSDTNLPPKILEFLTYLIFDEVGSIINYKASQAKDALGSLIVILAFEKLRSNTVFKINDDQFEEIWGDYSTNLRKSYEKGLRKVIKANNQDSWTQGMSKLNEFVKKEAEKESTKKINSLYKYIKK